MLSGLDRLDEPPSLLGPEDPGGPTPARVKLPELLLEVKAWTGLASDFTHVNEQGARADDLPIRVCAVLLVEACKSVLEPLVRPDLPALTRARRRGFSRATGAPTRELGWWAGGARSVEWIRANRAAQWQGSLLSGILPPREISNG